MAIIKMKINSGYNKSSYSTNPKKAIEKYDEIKFK